MKKKKEIEQERIEEWRNKAIKENLSYRLKKRNDSTEKETRLEVSFEKNYPLEKNLNNLTEMQKLQIRQATECAATGSADHNCSSVILMQAMSASCFDKDKAEIFANAVHATLLSMAPQDVIEGQLCSRIVVLHNQAMDFLNRAANSEQSEQGIDLNLNRATKLMRIHNETLEALNRYRRKGEQKVTVQHVNVNNGGQAIIAGQFNPGEGNDKN